MYLETYLSKEYLTTLKD